MRAVSSARLSMCRRLRDGEIAQQRRAERTYLVGDTPPEILWFRRPLTVCERVRRAALRLWRRSVGRWWPR